MRKLLIGLTFLTSISSFASNEFNKPVLNAWHKYYDKTGQFVQGGKYPQATVHLDAMPGILALSLFEDGLMKIGKENIAPIITGGTGQIRNGSGWSGGDGVFYLKKVTDQETSEIRIIGMDEEFAGEVKEWSGRSGAHACLGEEDNPRRNSWGLKKYSNEALEQVAMERLIERCVNAGGSISSKKITRDNHWRIRTFDRFGILPAPRKCLSSHVLVSCDFTDRKEEIKSLIDRFNTEYPNNPSATILNEFKKGL